MSGFREIKRMGERGILIQFEPEIGENMLKKVLFFQKLLQNKLFKSKVEIINTYNSLLINYPEAIEDSYSEILRLKEEMWEANIHLNFESKCFQIPVCYDEQFAPDLPRISEAKKLQKDEIIRLHTWSISPVFYPDFYIWAAFLKNCISRALSIRV